jgi:hypothetical protein
VQSIPAQKKTMPRPDPLKSQKTSATWTRRAEAKQGPARARGAPIRRDAANTPMPSRPQHSRARTRERTTSRLPARPAPCPDLLHQKWRVRLRPMRRNEKGRPHRRRRGDRPPYNPTDSKTAPLRGTSRLLVLVTELSLRACKPSPSTSAPTKSERRACAKRAGCGILHRTISGVSALVSVRRVFESYESSAIQGRWPDLGRVTDVDEQEPRPLRP